MACSGDMYSGVPKIIPVRVSLRLPSLDPEMSFICAMPKSTIFTSSRPSSVRTRKTFSGFKSR